MNFRRLPPLLLVVANLTSPAHSQETINDTTLRGTWLVGGSDIREAFTFSADGEFVHSYTITKKGGKDVRPVKKESEGAHKLAAAACSVGAKTGNLWVVMGSDRCCFNAYIMGKTLVLDQIPGLVISAPGSMCNSKTLKREPPRLAK